MVLIDSVKYACATCIKGHRSSTCNHDTRPLIEIKKKGRPVTQCVHCRELRKTKQVHVKCLCEGRPESGAATPRTVLPAAAVVAALAAPSSSGANNAASTMTATNAASGESSCDCKTRGGSCECCTPKHAPRMQATAIGGGGKPPGLTRGHTYHASSSSATSMNHDAGNHRTVGSKPSGAALQRSASLHGAAGSGASSTSSSHHHPNHSNGSHHPQPQHHPARHFAPYQLAHHSHHHHARFDLPDEEDAGDQFVNNNAAAAVDASENIPRRPRSSSVSHSDLSRPFPPPAPMYLNSTATMSLPDVLAWNSGDINPMQSYVQQQQQNGESQQSLADMGRASSTFLPAQGGEFDAFSASSADNFIRQFGSATNQVFDEPVSEGYSTNGNDVQFDASGLPGFRFASAEINLDTLDDGGAFEYRDTALTYNSAGVGPTSSEYDAVMASLLTLPQQSISAFGSGPGTVGSSGPPSMTGSLTSRSSSRASGGLPSALERLEMTSTDNGADRGRALRGFPPIADPFENEATTAIPPYDAFERPLQPQQRRLAAIDIEKLHSLSHSHSPMSQDSVSSGQDDGNGTQFPAWPQQHSPLSSTATHVGSGTASSAAGHSPFDPVEAFQFQTPAGAAALMYPGQRGPPLDFDDSAWIQRV